jgi:hypothetical protein
MNNYILLSSSPSPPLLNASPKQGLIANSWPPVFEIDFLTAAALSVREEGLLATQLPLAFAFAFSFHIVGVDMENESKLCGEYYVDHCTTTSPTSS